MLALGIVAGVCVTGSSLFKRPGTEKYLTGPTKQQRTLGLLAFLVVAASPLIRLWRTSLADLALLQQTLLLAAIGLLALLLFALLQRPLARRSTSYNNMAHTEQGIAAIHINADSTESPDKTVTTDRSPTIIPDSIEVIESPINLTQAANDNARAPIETIPDPSNLSFLNNLDQLVSNNIAETELAEIDLPAINVKAESLDLSSTEQLFADIRSQEEDVDLPNSEEWLADFDESVNLDDSIVIADEHIAAPSEADQANSIIEGELSPVEEPAESNQTIPATLAETLEMGKSHTATLQQHIDDLNKKLNELHSVHQQFSSEQQQSQLASAQMIINRDNFIDTEAKALQAAESVIAAQRKLLDHSKHQNMQIGQLLQTERSRLAHFRDEAARSKSMARQAAALARKAAVAHQTIRDMAKREQIARLRSQESAKKAVDIARNAITALAAEERKNASTHH